MATFRDRTGQTWEMTFTTEAETELRDAAGIDLAALATLNAEQLLSRWKTERREYASLIWVGVFQQARERRLTERQLLQRFDAVGEAISAAMLRAIAARYPGSELANGLSVIVNALRRGN